MPRMNILNAVEREAFDSPPVFNNFQRKQYFDFPSTPIRRWPPQSGLGGSLQAAHQELHHCWNYLYLSQKLEEIKDTARPGGVSRRGGPWLGGCLAAPQPARRV